jgi:hypothetical protein
MRFEWYSKRVGGSAFLDVRRVTGSLVAVILLAFTVLPQPSINDSHSEALSSVHPLLAPSIGPHLLHVLKERGKQTVAGTEVVALLVVGFARNPDQSTEISTWLEPRRFHQALVGRHGSRAPPQLLLFA